MSRTSRIFTAISVALLLLLVGIREGRWKLLVNNELKKTELYDLENDWAEMNDVSTDYPKVVQELSGKLDAWRDSLPTAAHKHCVSKARRKK